MINKRNWRSTAVSGILVATLLAVNLTAASATGLPGNGWWTGEQIQNIDSDAVNPATVSIVAYSQDGNSQYTADQRTVNQYASTTFLPYDFSNLPSGFQGSAVVSADKDIAAVVTVSNSYDPNHGLGDPNGAAKASYVGTNGNSANTTLKFPLAKNDFTSSSHKTTWFYVQNAGTVAADISFSFDMPGGCGTNPYVVSNIQPSTMAVVSPADAQCPTGVFGSLTVTSAQPLAGTVMESDTTAPVAGVKTMSGTRAVTPDMYSTTLYAPIVKKYWSRPDTGKYSGIQIQNVSGASIPAGHISIVYTMVACWPNACPNPTITQTNPTALDPSGPNSFWNITHNNSDPTLPPNSLASAIITSQPGELLAGIVNESSDTTVVPPVKTTYFAIPSSSATAKISLPQAKENWYGGRYTGIQVFSVGNPTVMHMKYQYTRKDGTTGELDVKTSTAVSSFTFYGLSRGWTTGYVCDTGTCDPNTLGNVLDQTVSGVTATSDNNTPIVAIANETASDLSTSPADANNYEGFNLQ